MTTPRGRTDLEALTGQIQVSQRLTDNVVGAVGEPALTALLLGKAAEANERGIDLEIAPGSTWRVEEAPTHDVVTIVNSLLDNAFDAVAGVERAAAGAVPAQTVRLRHRARPAARLPRLPGSGPRAAPVCARGWARSCCPWCPVLSRG